MPPSKGNPSRPAGTSAWSAPTAGGPRSGQEPRAVRVTPDLAHAAARRIVSQAGGDLDAAARRLLASAPQHGIDFALAFATLDDTAAPAAPQGSKGARASRGADVRQACLPVLGPGRTAMIFLSEPAPWEADAERATAERAACLTAVCEHLSTLPNGRVKIAQALPELEETWFEQALARGGFISVGTLSYMRQEPVALMRGKRPALPQLPPGVAVRWLSDPVPNRASGSAQPPEAQSDADLLAALDASYLNTLDCPELCGLRETADILASHKSTGTFDPSLWMLITMNDVPSGCVLLSRCPEQRTIELVYLGLGEALRGKGLGKLLLSHCIAKARTATPGWPVTCAVDERNIPALRLYGGMGFTVFGRRRALVRPV